MLAGYVYRTCMAHADKAFSGFLCFSPSYAIFLLLLLRQGEIRIIALIVLMQLVHVVAAAAGAILHTRSLLATKLAVMAAKRRH